MSQQRWLSIPSPTDDEVTMKVQKDYNGCIRNIVTAMQQDGRNTSATCEATMSQRARNLVIEQLKLKGYGPAEYNMGTKGWTFSWKNPV